LERPQRFEVIRSCSGKPPRSSAPPVTLALSPLTSLCFVPESSAEPRYQNFLTGTCCVGSFGRLEMAP
ncbi:hypothetical protein CIB84_011600, partial [Bambusicola thoracicus]